MSHEYPNVLLLDIETAPARAYVWGLYDQNISLDQIIQAGYILCVSWKWLGEKDVHYVKVAGNETTALLKLHNLLNKADIVVHYNGIKFDIPTLNRELLLHSLPPPSPVKHIDLLRVVRKQFKFSSNKLDFVCQQLGLGNKVQHKGMKLWDGCMANDAASWKVMKEYNMQDVVLLEKLYYRLRPWIEKHPNLILHTKNNNACPRCLSEHVHKRGTYKSASVSYTRYQCQTCFGWFKGLKDDTHTSVEKTPV